MFSFSLRRETPFDCLNLQVSVLEGCPGWRGQLNMEGGHDFSGERQKMMRMMRMRMRRMISMISVIFPLGNGGRPRFFWGMTKEGEDDEDEEDPSSV